MPRTEITPDVAVEIIDSHWKANGEPHMQKLADHYDKKITLTDKELEEEVQALRDCNNMRWEWSIAGNNATEGIQKSCVEGTVLSVKSNEAQSLILATCYKCRAACNSILAKLQGRERPYTRCFKHCIKCDKWDINNCLGLIKDLIVERREKFEEIRTTIASNNWKLEA